MRKQTAVSSSASQDDQQAIARVIRDETLAFQRQDYAAWERCWAQNVRTRDVFISTTSGISVLSGWSAIAAHMRNVFENRLSDQLIDFGQEDLQVEVIGDCAWAVFDTWSIWQNGDSGESFDTRILERQDGQWRIVYASFVLRQNNAPEGLVIGLDRKGHIVQSSKTGLDTLKAHPFLTISRGRIRAQRLDWDKELQNALLQAGRHHGFFETYRFADSLGGPAQYPMVLGQTDEGGVVVVNLSIRDGVTYLSVTNDHFLNRRMKFAQTVFSLSDRQMKVARQIAMGESIKEAASNLGISINTARTHLARLYEKTGVRTQAALVRLLLSVG